MTPFSLFDDFFNRGLTSFQIELAVLGLRKEDLRINLEHNLLTISARQESRYEESPASQSQPQGQSTANDVSAGQPVAGEQAGVPPYRWKAMSVQTR